MTRFFDETAPVIDRRYVVFTTAYASLLLTGTRVDKMLKGRLLHINAEPTLEKGSVRHDGHLLEVWLPQVILRDEANGNTLYQVVYDPHFVLGPAANEAALIQEAILRPNAWNPITRA